MTDETRDDTPADDVLLAGPDTDAPPVWCFSLFLAEVIFTCNLGVQTRRLQFVSKSDGEIFPQSRLLQLQQLAAKNAINDVFRESNGAIKVEAVEAVYLLNCIPLGWMTEEQFTDSQTTSISVGETESVDNGDLPPPPDNVVQFRSAETPSAD